MATMMAYDSFSGTELASTEALHELEADNARLRAFALRLLMQRDKLRVAAARQLFDSVAQQLAGVQFELAAAKQSCTGHDLNEQLHNTRLSVLAALEEVRNLAGSLNGGEVEDLGLEAALQRLARALPLGTGIEIDVKFTLLPVSLALRSQIVLYRAIEEAALNAVRHGTPRHIWINLSGHEGLVTAEVRDDGRGFILNRKRANGDGIIQMREQLELVGGTLNVSSAPGNGTVVVITVPIAGSR